MHSSYESNELLNQYLLFHYGTREQLFPYELPFDVDAILEFPVRCVWDGLDFNNLKSRERALDLGCAVGRSSFELSQNFDSVYGIDYSKNFISAAEHLKNYQNHPLELLLEGHKTLSVNVNLPPNVNPNRVNFSVGNAESLSEELGVFDSVLACNLICRLRNPINLLNRFSNLVRPGGQLFITTPFTWLEQFTPPDNWLNMNAKDSFSGLRSVLEDNGHFSLVKSWNMPFLIREHSRKFQFSMAHASRWVRL